MVTKNLIDAYDLLVEFIAKHTLDRFFLIEGQSVSVRSKISRELVSNILVHREYTSAYPAKIIIESCRIVTENWCLPKTPGRIDPNTFTPYPKNPLLANFFTNIGRADVLGSGVRNLYRYSKIYSGGEPELVEGDVFRTIVPLGLSDIEASDNKILSDKMSDNGILSDNVSDKMSDNRILSDKMSDKNHCDMILAYIAEKGEINAKETAELIGRSSATARRVLSQLADEGVIAASGGNRNRKYRAAVYNMPSASLE
jgi:ATP-dependent DNA helicase RecG